MILGYLSVSEIDPNHENHRPETLPIQIQMNLEDGTDSPFQPSSFGSNPQHSFLNSEELQQRFQLFQESDRGIDHSPGSSDGLFSPPSVRTPGNDDGYVHESDTQISLCNQSAGLKLEDPVLDNVGPWHLLSPRSAERSDDECSTPSRKARKSSHDSDATSVCNTSQNPMGTPAFTVEPAKSYVFTRFGRDVGAGESPSTVDVKPVIQPS